MPDTMTSSWTDALAAAESWLGTLQARRAADGLAPVVAEPRAATDADITWASTPGGHAAAVLGRCEACLDTGHRIERRDVGRGPYDVAVPCACLPLARACQRYTEARVPLLRGLAGASLEPREKDPRAGLDWTRGKLATVRPVLREWMARVEASGPRPVLLLCGPTGSGKTHIAAGMARTLLFRRSWMATSATARWVRWRDYLDACKGDREARDASRRARLLIVDELSACARDWGATELEDLLDVRTSADAALILTTNLRAPGPDVPADQDVSEAVGARAWSRIRGAGVVVDVVAPDYRGEP